MRLPYAPTEEDKQADQPSVDACARWKEMNEEQTKNLVLRHVVYVQNIIEGLFEIELSMIELYHLRRQTEEALRQVIAHNTATKKNEELLSPTALLIRRFCREVLMFPVEKIQVMTMYYGFDRTKGKVAAHHEDLQYM